MQISLGARKRNTEFYILKYGVPERRSSKGNASFKRIKPWPGHVEGILGVSVVGLVINEELRQVVWRIVIKNFMHKYPFVVSELL